jgi:hypothetical protein
VGWLCLWTHFRRYASGRVVIGRP